MASGDVAAADGVLSDPSRIGLLCYARAEFLDTGELSEEEKTFRDHRIANPLPGYVTGTLLARRALFDTVGQLKSALGHGDGIEWFLRATEHGSVVTLLPDVLLYRCLHQNNRSRFRAAISRDQYLQILKVSLDQRRR